MPEPEMKTAAFTAKIEVDEEERTIVSAISTSVRDRDDEVMLPSGVMLDNYRKNPVVLWAHNRGAPPIGKNLWVDVKRDRLMAKTKFADTELAREIFALYAGGYLKAWSVGFTPLEHHEPTEQELRKRPEWAGVRRVFDKWELLEYSGCPIPANPEALTLAMSKGLVVPPEVAALGTSITVADDVVVEEEEYAETAIVLTEEEMAESLSLSMDQVDTLRYGDVSDMPEPELKPYPNEHACRLKDPAQYDTCRRGTRSHDGKRYSVIFCKKQGGNMEEQAYRYDKNVWTAAQAKTHCGAHEGRFEAAAPARGIVQVRPAPIPEPQLEVEILPAPDLPAPSAVTFVASPDSMSEQVDAKLKGQVTWED